MAVQREMKPHNDFMKLLCKAAGVDQLKVRAIECRAAAGEPIRFTVDTIASEDILETVTLDEKYRDDPNL